MKNHIIIATIFLSFFCLVVFGQKNISTEKNAKVDSLETYKDKAFKLSRAGKYIDAIKIIEEWLDKTDKEKINDDIISAYEVIFLLAGIKAENTEITVAWIERLLSFLNRKEVIADKSLADSICFSVAQANYSIKDPKIKDRFYKSLIAYRRKELNDAKKTKQRWEVLSCYEELVDILAKAKKSKEAMLKAKEALKYYEGNIVKNDDFNPSIYAIYTSLSNLYVECKEYSKAVKTLKRFIKVCKKDIYKSWIYVGIAKVYIKSKDFTNAQKALEKAVLSNTKSAGCDNDLIQNNFLEIGKVYRDIRQYELAVKYIGKSNKKGYFYSGNMTDVYFCWGEYLASQGEWEKAIDKLQKAQKWTDKNDFESHCDLLVNKAFCYSALNEFEKAKANLKSAFKSALNLPRLKKENKIAELFSEQILLYLKEASYLRSKRKFMEAKTSLAQANNILAKISDKNVYKEHLASIYLAHGWLCYDQDKYSDAITFYKKAINVYGSDFNSKYIRAADTYLHLAGAYQDDKQAEKYYKKALNIANKNEKDVLLQATIHYFLGIYYCKNKRYESGIKSLQTAVEKLKKDDKRFSKKIAKINSKIKYYRNFSINKKP